MKSDDQRVGNLEDCEFEEETVFDAVDEFIDYLSDNYGESTVEEVTEAILTGLSKLNCAFAIPRDLIQAKLIIVYERVKEFMQSEGSYGCMSQPKERSGTDLKVN